jgi:hypothetical protein
MSDKKYYPPKVFFVRDETGAIWKETVSTELWQTKVNFANMWLSRIPNLDRHEASQLWYLFEKRGWTIEELEINKAQ